MKTKHSGGLHWSREYIQWMVYGLCALLLVTVQNAPRLFPAIAGARPVPVILFVVCVALFGGARVGAIVGVITGLLWDVYAFRLFGFDALVLLLIGLAVGLLVELLMRANFFSAMLLCTGAVLFHGLCEWLFCHVIFLQPEALSLLVRVYLPNGLYTVLLAPAMYGLTLLLARFVRRRANS